MSIEPDTAAPSAADLDSAAARRALAERLLAARLRRSPRPAVAGPTHGLSDGDAATRLSFAQERMWFLHTMAPDSPAYHITSVARLSGVVDEAALRSAVAALTRRHGALRTSFGTDAHGLPLRRIAPAVAPPLTVVAAGTEAEADRVVAADLRRPFDLAVAPLLRLLLVRLGPDRYRLALTVHHLVADGWSLGILHRELAELYAAARDGGGEPPRPVGSVDDLVAAERRWVASPAGAASRRYWRERLGDLSQLELPMARPRPAVARSEGRRREYRLPEVLARDLTGLGQRYGASLYMVLAAAFATLLHRYSGQEDVVFGSPVANRADPALAGVVGLFVNSVVLRTDLSGRPSFADVLGRVRRATLDALEHQQTPFEQLVDDLRPERSLSHNPLFQAIFALQNAGGDELALPGTRAEVEPQGFDGARFDLEWTLWREPSGLRLRVNYRTDLFDEGVPERLVTEYERLLRAAVATPEAPVAGLAVFAATGGSDRAAPPPAGTPRPLTEKFAAVAAARPQAVALADAAGELTFAELDRRAGVVAARLHAAGVRRGDVVGVCTARTAALVVATLGVLRAGAAFLPLNPDDPVARRAFMLADTNARALVTDRPADAVPPGGAVLTVGSTMDGEQLGPVVAVGLDDLAYVIYTSGTTGQPKGVAVEHGNIANTLLAVTDRLGFGPDDVGLVLAAGTFDVFYYELFATMLAGGRSYLVDRAELFDPARIVPLLRRATSFQAVPGLMEHLLTALADAGVTELPGLRVVMTGGDLVPATLLRTLAGTFPRAQIVVTYGPTEAAIFCTGYRLPPDRAVTGHPIGTPLPGAEIRVVDPDGNPLPANIAGEIWIGGRGVARGYLNRPEETRERFVVHDGRRYYRSGDRARWRGDGELEFLGRADNQVKVRGFRIELGEVEAALVDTPGVRHGVVVPVGDVPSERRLVAYIVPEDPGEGTDPLGAQLVGEWREIFDRTHTVAAAGTRDYTGWNSSYTGAPMPAAEMDEWLAGTVAQVRDRLGAGTRPSILEIGCGTGLLLHELAGDCARYVGLDFSATTLRALDHLVRERGLTQVTLLRAEAAELPDIVGTGFDAVIINSVSQYLPDAAHLGRVLDGALARVRPGGFVFVGDVRSLPLLPVLHAAVLAARPADPAAEVPAAEQLAAARQRAAGEGELVLSPAWFSRYATADARIAAVELEPRRGGSGNELTRYRYDAVLWRTGPRPVPDVAGLTWCHWTEVPDLADRLATRPERLALTGIPHGLAQPEVLRYATLARAAGEAYPVAAGPPLVPEELRRIAATAGYRAALSWARSDPDGSYDAILTRLADPAPRRVPWPVADPAPVPPANAPTARLRQQRLAAEVKAGLERRLPSYMVPAVILPVPSLPLTPNGKVDRSRLPAVTVVASPGRPPASPVEVAVAHAWREALGREVDSVTEDFFTAGGTSLLAIRVTVALRQRGLAMVPQQLFELRTVERLAGFLDRGGPAAGGPETPRVPGPAVVTAPAPRPVDAAGPDAWAATGHALLTGATGMLGVHLLDDALRHYPDLTLTCLVRADDDGAARHRLAGVYRWYFPDSPISEADLARRVRVVAGDLRRPRLGLTEPAWRALAGGLDAVLHAAADVRHVAPEADLYATNTDGTARVLELVAATPVPRLVHVSTVGVGGRSPDGAPRRLGEDELDIGQRHTEAYSRSKHAAERAVRAYARDHEHTTILRVGTVAPHSVTGRFQHNIDEHFLSRFVRGVLALGVATGWAGRRLGLVPADVMARAVFALSGQAARPATAAAGPVTFHLQSPPTLSYGRIAEWLRELGYPIQIRPAGEFAAEVTRLGADPARVEDIGRLLPVLSDPAGAPVELPLAYTQEWLHRLGIVLPEPSRPYLERFVRHGVEVGYFPPLKGA
jgi:amino acid adenylation domain-containing protein/thioester reductase-like protein